MSDRSPIINGARTLATFAFLIGTILYTVQYFTAGAIQNNRDKALRQSLEAVLNGSQYNNQPNETKLTLVDSGASRTVYKAYQDQQPSAVAITSTAPDGYSGDIDMLVGLSYEGVITGVRVLQHRETPGLGDKIDHNKSNWIITFNGESLAADLAWTVRKEGGNFDQFTGATITPRAVVKSVKRTLDWYAENRQRIFEHQ